MKNAARDIINNVMNDRKLDDETRKQSSLAEFVDKPLIRIPSTITFKEIMVLISMVATSVLAYGTLSARVSVLEETVSSHTQMISEWKQASKDSIEEVKGSLKSIQILDEKMKDSFETKIDKIEERLRALEIQNAKRK